MTSDRAPWHAHIYAHADELDAAKALRDRLSAALASGEMEGLRYVGRLAGGPVGPHPLPQFEVHFVPAADLEIRRLIAASSLTALIHPLTDDDLADHTSLAQWIGQPLPLDVSVLDPPGINQGLPRFGKADF
jgi:aromatic ring-cleaving dioxygenase